MYLHALLSMYLYALLSNHLCVCVRVCACVCVCVCVNSDMGISMTAATKARCCHICNRISLFDLYLSTTESVIAGLIFISRRSS